MTAPSIHLVPGKGAAWRSVLREIRSAPDIALFLDYDGTLTRIRRERRKAHLPVRTADILRRLSRLPSLEIGIVTGRSMPDIRSRVPIRQIDLAANHGLHLRRQGMDWIHPGIATLQSGMVRFRRGIRSIPKAFPGCSVEDKTLTVSIHYRGMARGLVTPLISAVRQAASSADPALRITSGKKVLEIRPPIPWGKGEAILELLRMGNRKEGTLAVFIGDDATDEDAFRVLRRRGLTIRVGPDRVTQAKYYLTGTSGVLELLKRILAVRADNRAGTARKQRPEAVRPAPAERG